MNPSTEITDALKQHKKTPFAKLHDLPSSQGHDPRDEKAVGSFQGASGSKNTTSSGVGSNNQSLLYAESHSKSGGKPPSQPPSFNSYENFQRRRVGQTGPLQPQAAGYAMQSGKRSGKGPSLKESQESGGTPSNVPSVSPSITPSYAISSTYPNLSDVVKLTEEDECWLGKQLIVTDNIGQIENEQIISQHQQFTPSGTQSFPDQSLAVEGSHHDSKENKAPRGVIVSERDGSDDGLNLVIDNKTYEPSDEDHVMPESQSYLQESESSQTYNLKKSDMQASQPCVEDKLEPQITLPPMESQAAEPDLSEFQRQYKLKQQKARMAAIAAQRRQHLKKTEPIEILDAHSEKEEEAKQEPLPEEPPQDEGLIESQSEQEPEKASMVIDDLLEDVKLETSQLVADKPFEVKTFNPEEHVNECTEKSGNQSNHASIRNEVIEDYEMKPEETSAHDDKVIMDPKPPSPKPSLAKSEGSRSRRSRKSRKSSRQENSNRSENEFMISHHSHHSSHPEEAKEEEEEEPQFKKALFNNPFGIQSQVSSDTYSEAENLDYANRKMDHSGESKKSMTPISVHERGSLSEGDNKHSNRYSSSDSRGKRLSQLSGDPPSSYPHHQQPYPRRDRYRFKEEIHHQIVCLPNEGIIEKKENTSIYVKSESSHPSMWIRWTDNQDWLLTQLVDEMAIEQIDELQHKLNQAITNGELVDPKEEIEGMPQETKSKEEIYDRWVFLHKKQNPIRRQRARWTNEEDEMLQTKIKEYPQLNPAAWKEISSEMTNRSMQQCHERWQSYLKPDHSREWWSIREDMDLIFLSKSAIKNKWLEIKQYMHPNWSDNELRNRYNTTLRRFRKVEDYLKSVDKRREKKANQKKSLPKPYNSKRMKQDDLSYLKNMPSSDGENPFDSGTENQMCCRKSRPRGPFMKKKKGKKEKSADQMSADISKGKKSKYESRYYEFANHESAYIAEMIQCSQNDFFKRRGDFNSKSFVQTRSTSSVAAQNKKGLFCLLEKGDHLKQEYEQSENLDSENEALVRNLLQLELPKVLSDNKLLFRKIFKCQQLSPEEAVRRGKMNPITNSFETFTMVPPENTGPKVLYITAKGHEGKEHESEILKDIEGHPIEKIQPMKFLEKAYLEDQEYKSVNQAMESLRKLRDDGASEEELWSQAVKLWKQIISQVSELSGQSVEVEALDTENKIAEVSTPIPQQMLQKKGMHPNTSFQTPKTDMGKHRVSTNSHNNGFYHLGYAQANQQIFTVHYVEKREPLEEGKFVPLNLMKDEEMNPQGHTTYNSRLLDSSGISGSAQLYDRSMIMPGPKVHYSQPMNLNQRPPRPPEGGKHIQINKEGNTASINIIGQFPNSSRRDFRNRATDKSMEAEKPPVTSASVKTEKKVEPKDAKATSKIEPNAKAIDTSKASGSKNSKTKTEPTQGKSSGQKKDAAPASGKNQNQKADPPVKAPVSKGGAKSTAPSKAKGTPKDAKVNNSVNLGTRRGTPTAHQASKGKLSSNPTSKTPVKGRTTENSKATLAMVRPTSRSGISMKAPEKSTKSSKLGSKGITPQNANASANTSGFGHRNSTRLQAKKIEDEKKESPLPNLKNKPASKSKQDTSKKQALSHKSKLHEDRSDTSFITSGKKSQVFKKRDIVKAEKKMAQERDTLKNLFTQNAAHDPEPDKTEANAFLNLRQSLKRYEMLKNIQEQLDQINKHKTQQGKEQSSFHKKSSPRTKKLEDVQRTRQSQRLKLLNNNGKHLNNRVPPLNENEIRAEEKDGKLIEKLKMETSMVIEGNCYNNFIKCGIDHV